MRVIVAGGTGLLGSAVLSEYSNLGHEVLSISRKEVDLTDLSSTTKIMMDLRPDLLVDAAARVGGISANNSQPVEFLIDNLRIQNNLMTSAHEANVKRVIFMGSSCIYPRECSQPIKEDYLLTGRLEETNSAYAIAKIAGIELIRAFRKEYGRSWISLMPTNLYGPRDNFAENGSHVIPALVRKFVDAEKSNIPVVELWGDGSPYREFLHVEDAARAIVLAAERYDDDLHLNIGSSEEVTIRDLAFTIAKLAGFQGEIRWNTSMPNGTPRKILDSSRLRSLGWVPQVSLEDGLRSTIDWYRSAVDLGEVRL